MSTLNDSTENNIPCLICTKGSISSQPTNLTWSLLFELPSWFADVLFRSVLKRNDLKNLDAHRKKIMSYLDIIMEPPLEIVIQQLDILASEVLKHLPELKDMEKKLGTIYNQFYDFLLDKQEKGFLHPGVHKKLENVPIMFFPDKLLVMIPARVSLGYNEYNSIGEIQPYLIKYPLNLGNYFNLFKTLGCTEEFTLTQYCSVLEQIWKDTKGRSLTEKENPNDFIAIQKAMHGVLSKLEKANKDEIEKISQLFVFTKNKCLQNIEETYYFDSRFRNDQKKKYLQRLGSLNKFILELVHIQPIVNFSSFNLDILFSKLPENLRPIPLSSILQQQITKTSLAQITHDKSKPGVRLALHLEEKFNSQDFIELIARILLFSTKSNNANQCWKNEEELCAFVGDKLGNLNFSCCCGLQSILLLNDIAQEDSVQECEYFVSQTNEIFFNDMSDFDLFENSNRLTTELFYKINSLFSDQLKEFRFDVQQIIKTTNKGKMKYILSDIDVPELSEKICNVYLPEPGSQIPQKLHFSLHQNFSSFIKGEYVGFELEDPVEVDCQGEPKLIYAVVESEIIEGDSPSAVHLKVYSIRISSDELIKVPAVTLYKLATPVHVCDASDTSDQSNEILCQSNEAILESVNKILHDIRYLPVELQNKIIKRLLMQCASKINPEKEKLYQQITLLINQHYDKNHGDLTDNLISDLPLHKAWESASAVYNSSYRRNYKARIKPNAFKEYLFKRTNAHRADQQRYEKDYYHSQTLSANSPYYFPKPSQKNSKPLRARKLFLQVTHDLEILEALPESDWSHLACYLVS